MKKLTFIILGIIFAFSILLSVNSFVVAAPENIGTDFCVGYENAVYYKQTKSGKTVYRSYYRSSYFIPYNYLGDKVWDKTSLVFASFTAVCANDL